MPLCTVSDIAGVPFRRVQVLDGEKIVSRKRGFTVDACSTAVSVADEDAQGARYQGLSIQDKVGLTATS